MIYDDMRELVKLVKLVRQDEQYCAAVMSGKVEPDDALKDQHAQRAERITELSARYGLL